MPWEYWGSHGPNPGPSGKRFGSGGRDKMTYRHTDRLDRHGPRMQAINPDPAGLGKVRNRASAEITGVNLSVGAVEEEDIYPGGGILRADLFDFIVDAADLDFGAGPVTPEPGWEFERGNGEVYRVVSAGDNEPAFKFITASKLRMRVHTSRVGS